MENALPDALDGKDDSNFIALGDSGIILFSPFFVSTSFAVLLTQLTFSHLRSYSSPRRIAVSMAT